MRCKYLNGLAPVFAAFFRRLAKPGKGNHRGISKKTVFDIYFMSLAFVMLLSPGCA
jgi:hypothetical protein